VYENICSTERMELLLQTKLSDKRAVGALIRALKILEVLAAIGDKAQKTAAGVLILIILAQMSTQFLNATRQKRDLHLRRTGIGVVSLRFRHLILLLALREHGQRIAQQSHFCKTAAQTPQADS
jgi:hypothetical protein